MASAADIPTVPADLSTKFQTTFYQDVNDSAFKALCEI
jgi:ATP-dependent Lon protease